MGEVADDLEFDIEKTRYIENLAQEIDDCASDTWQAFRELEDAERSHNIAQSRYNYLYETEAEKRKLYRMLTGEEYLG